MRDAARAIVIHNDQLLIIHRNKFGTEYNTLPGGRIEPDETAEQAVLRELAEETQVTVRNPKLVYMEPAGDKYGNQNVFLCEYVSGEPELRSDSEEAQNNKYGLNLYTPMWLPLSELPKTTFKSDRIKSAILTALDSGWPEQVLEV